MDSNSRPTLWLIPSTMSDAPVSDVIPARNTEIASELLYFIVENVRTARRFLKRCNPAIDINRLTFFTLNTHTAPEDIPEMLAPMAEGHDIGVISEAGCPAVADPGADVVAIAQTRGYRVVPLVGPSSIIMGLMASGFNGQSFAFNGYLPVDRRERAEKLKQLERLIVRGNQTQIFIETPYRNNKLIAELAETMPPALKLCVASDLTGPDESALTMPLSKWSRAKYNYDKRPTLFLLYK